MEKIVKLVKGFSDLLPPESALWQRAERAVRDIFECYGFQEVRLPILEHTELFTRSIGQTTDIVEKEMYSFQDRKGRSLCLRPEGTASAVRAYISSGPDPGVITKWYYSGPMFRYERPQKGRYRQFWQMGVELFGDPGPASDAEILAMLKAMFNRLGIESVFLEINSLGCPACRPAYRDKLAIYLDNVQERLCPECQRKRTTNPLRVLDCKEPGCIAAVKDAPTTLESLCPDCEKHFSGLKKYLDNLEVDYKVNPRIVRGLDYYTRTAFEFLAGDGLGSQNAVAAGGRYDNLVEELGGPKTPAIGFAMGLDRLTLLISEDKKPKAQVDIFVAALGEKAFEFMFPLVNKLREAGLKIEMLPDQGSRGLKAKMKYADRLAALRTLIIGDDELKNGYATLRHMVTGDQDKIVLEELEKKLIKYGTTELPYEPKTQNPKP